MIYSNINFIQIRVYSVKYTFFTYLSVAIFFILHVLFYKFYLKIYEQSMETLSCEEYEQKYLI